MPLVKKKHDFKPYGHKCLHPPVGVSTEHRSQSEPCVSALQATHGQTTANVRASANLKWTVESNTRRDGGRKRSVHTGGSWVEAEPLALLAVLLLRCSRRLKVAVRLARSTAAGDSRYTRSLWDWLIPGSFRWWRRRKKNFALFWRKLPGVRKHRQEGLKPHLTFDPDPNPS